MYAWYLLHLCAGGYVCLSITPQGHTSHNTNFKNKDLTICKFLGFHTAVILWDMTL